MTVLSRKFPLSLEKRITKIQIRIFFNPSGTLRFLNLILETVPRIFIYLFPNFQNTNRRSRLKKPE